MKQSRAVRDRGATAVEFGLLLPLLLTLLLGIAEFGYLLNQQLSMTQAARAGAREYALHKDLSEVNKVVNWWSEPSPAGVVAAVAITDPDGLPAPSCAYGYTVTVTATKTYRSLTGWFDGMLPDDITVKGKGAMRCGG